MSYWRWKVDTHFIETAVVISPINGAPAVYSLKNGKKIDDLEKDAYLTYITEMDGYIASQYISTDGKTVCANSIILAEYN